MADMSSPDFQTAQNVSWNPLWSTTTANNTNQTNTTTTLPTLLPQPQHHSSFSSPSDLTANILAMGWIIIFFYCCCCHRSVPGPEHWRGEQMRRNYQEMLARERAKEQRESQTPEYRQRLVTHNMRTKRVISQDVHGNWTLGNVVANIPSSCSPSPSNTPTTDTDVEHVDNNYDNNYDDNQEDHACVICLDSFHVGDIVSWSRCSDDCQHVFHADCIGQWLQGKRQDDCPSCRHRIILEEPPDLEEAREGECSEPTSTPAIAPVEDAVVDREEDSFFMIVHGLISRAANQAKQASRYTLISTQNSSKSANSSTDEMDTLMMADPLPLASPLRRVASHEPRPSPPTLIMGRRGANLTPTLASSSDAVVLLSSSPLPALSIHSFLSPSSPSNFSTEAATRATLHQGPTVPPKSVLPHSTFESDNGGIYMDTVSTASTKTITTTALDSIMIVESCRNDDTIFRRVQSDIGAPSSCTTNTNVVSSNCSRRYPMMRSRTKVPSMLQSGCYSVSSSSTGGDEEETTDDLVVVAPPTIADDIFRHRLRPVTPTGDSDMDMDHVEEEDELQWIAGGPLPASPSRDSSHSGGTNTTPIQYGGRDADEQV